MARIRSIRPEFWASESMGRASRDARLLFIGLWSMADDAGRFRAHPRLLAAELFPYDADALARLPGWLGELEREGSIELYRVDGNSYGHIPKWREHQKIDHPTASRLPDPSLASPREDSRDIREPSRNAREDSGEEGKGREGSGEEGSGREAPRKPAPVPSTPAWEFWVWFQEAREQVAGLVREKPPHPAKLGAFYSEALMELGGNVERLRDAVHRFGDDTFWEAKGYPWAAFVSQWRKYVPQAA